MWTNNRQAADFLFFYSFYFLFRSLYLAPRYILLQLEKYKKYIRYRQSIEKKNAEGWKKDGGAAAGQVGKRKRESGVPLGVQRHTNAE